MKTKNKPDITPPTQQEILEKQLGATMAMSLIIKQINPKDGGIIETEDFNRVKTLLAMWDMKIQDRLKEIKPDRKHLVL